MNPLPASNPYKRHRFPAEIIGHCVWLYFRFCLSCRDVEELMAEGIVKLISPLPRLLPRMAYSPHEPATRNQLV
jgi:hypothetical protein